MPLLVKLNNAKPLRIIHVITEDSRPTFAYSPIYSSSQTLSKPITVKYIVSENKGARLASNPFFTNKERLRQTFWSRL